MKQLFSACILGGDEVHLELELKGDWIQHHSWKILGRLELFAAVESFQKRMGDSVAEMPIPEGQRPENLLLRELILKAKHQWPQTPSDPELCHCRKISQAVVERAVILGANTLEKVKQRTSANTGCGTCLPEIEEIFERYKVV